MTEATTTMTRSAFFFFTLFLVFSFPLLAHSSAPLLPGHRLLNTYIKVSEHKDINELRHIDFSKFDNITLSSIGISVSIRSNIPPAEPNRQENIIDISRISPTLPSFIELAHQNGCKVLLSFQGTNDFNSIVMQPQVLKQFATEILSFSFKYGADGIDIDWEATVTPREHLLLIRALRDELNASQQFLNRPNFLLTTAVSTALNYPVELQLELSSIVNLVNVMTYDLGGGIWGRIPTHNTPLDRISARLSAWSNFPREKICVGMANYGFLYRGLTPGQVSIEPLRSKGRYILFTEFTESGMIDWKRKYDESAASSYYISPDGADFVTIEDPMSVKTKAAHFRKSGYSCAFWWVYHGDAIPTVGWGSNSKERNTLIDVFRTEWLRESR